MTRRVSRRFLCASLPLPRMSWSPPLVWSIPRFDLPSQVGARLGGGSSSEAGRDAHHAAVRRGPRAERGAQRRSRGRERARGRRRRRLRGRGGRRRQRRRDRLRGASRGSRPRARLAGEGTCRAASARGGASQRRRHRLPPRGLHTPRCLRGADARRDEARAHVGRLRVQARVLIRRR